LQRLRDLKAAEGRALEHVERAEQSPFACEVERWRPVRKTVDRRSTQAEGGEVQDKRRRPRSHVEVEIDAVPFARAAYLTLEWSMEAQKPRQEPAIVGGADHA